MTLHYACQTTPQVPLDIHKGGTIFRALIFVSQLCKKKGGAWGKAMSLSVKMQLSRGQNKNKTVEPSELSE